MALSDIKSEQNSPTSSSAVVEHKVQKHGFPAFDTTYFVSHLFWLAVSFALFYSFISKIIVPRVASGLGLRHDRIAADLDHAARLKSQIDEIVLKSDSILAEARINAKHVIEEAKADAKALSEEHRKQLEIMLNDRVKQCDDDLKEMRISQLDNIKHIENDLVPILVEKLSNGIIKAG